MQNNPSFHHARVRLLDGSGYGDIWLSCDAEGDYHALKIVHGDRFDNADLYAWEIHDASKFQPVSLEHEGLADILDISQNDAQGCLYCVMELADDAGGVPAGDSMNTDAYQPKTLAGELARRGPLPAAECADIALGLVRALGFVHQQGFVHPDTTSANIIIAGGRAKFSTIARIPDSPLAVATDAGFAPPEGGGSVQGDIYSLGKVLYEMLTGNNAARFPEWTDVREPAFQTLRTRLKEIISKACDNDPGKRYATCGEMEADLQAAQTAPVRKAQGGRKWMPAVAVAAVILVAGGAWWWKQKSGTPATPPPPSPAPAIPPHSAPASPPFVPPPAPASGTAQNVPPVPSFRTGKTLFADAFDADTAARWIVLKTSGDTAAVFGWDYSGMGIPPAPGSKRPSGLRLMANMAPPPGLEVIALYPKEGNFTGNYRLKFHLWLNANGPFPEGGPGSTQFFMTGAGASGRQMNHNADTNKNEGVWFTVNGDGDYGSRRDFTAWRGRISLFQTTPDIYAAGADQFARGNTHPYYARTFPGGQSPPGLQTEKYPGVQIGTLPAGCVGLAWRTVEVVKAGGRVWWSMDGLLIASVSIGNEPFHNNVFIGYVDSLDSVSAVPELCFAVVANLAVEEIIP